MGGINILVGVAVLFPFVMLLHLRHIIKVGKSWLRAKVRSIPSFLAIKISSLYYRVVVIKAPLQGLCYTVRDAVDW